MNYKTQFINDSDKLYWTTNAVCLKNKTVVGLTSPQYIIKATNQALLSELNRIDPTNRKLNKSYMYMLNGSCVHTVLQYVWCAILWTQNQAVWLYNPHTQKCLWENTSWKHDTEKA